CMVTREANFLHLQWQMMLNRGADDRLVVLVYDGDIFRHFHDTGVPRSQLHATLEIASLEHLEQPAHVYATFWDPLLDQISDSVFCGTILPETAASGQ